jgi:uridine kinase
MTNESGNISGDTSGNNLLGDRLRRGMTEKGVNQGKLAEITGISQGYISALVSSAGKKKNPSQECLSKLAAPLGIDLRELFEICGYEPEATARPILIGISGPSGAGKSWFANKLATLANGAIATISLDSFYKERDQVEHLPYRHDDPASIDFEGAFECIVKLKANQEADVPEYCYASSTKIGEKRLIPLPIIVIEGHLLFLHKPILRHLDLKVWIDTDLDIALSRRIERDLKERESETRATIARWRKDVMPAFNHHLRSRRSDADMIVVNNGEDASAMPKAAQAIMAYIKQLPYSQVK